jgi:hypothetical protein
MNRRLKELAEQAGYPDHMTYGQDLVLERFAQSIVRECAEVCDLYGMPDGTSQTAMILSAAIKRKFGVE